MHVRHGEKDKLLWVADSISSNLDFKHIADKIDMTIKHAKAYTVTADSPGAKFPNRNFLDVVEKECDETDFSVLVLGGGTVEITNLDTTQNPEENIIEFKEKVFAASKKMFNLAECALQTYPCLEKVIILKKPPRFDPKDVDPMELKPQLSKLGNSILFELWCNSNFKGKIIIGDHQIPHLLDDSHHQVYGHPDLDHYDGLHLHGPDGRAAFQKSILNILKTAGLVSTLTETNTSNKTIKDIPDGKKNTSDAYDPMKMFKNRHKLRKNSSNHQNFHKDGLDEAGNQPPRPSVRPTVIRSSSLQNRYTVPVGNTFDMLGN